MPKLQQVFLNLLSNALQALETMPDQAPKRILLGLSSSLFDGDEVVEYVLEDTGPGIPAELVPRIFDPFFTTKEAGEGTGLGLSLAYAIIEEHSGEIRYEAGADGGARFVIRVPRATGSTQECETPAETVEGSQTTGRPPGGGQNETRAGGGQTKRVLSDSLGSLGSLASRGGAGAGMAYGCRHAGARGWMGSRGPSSGSRR